jgi:mono/diheme cytochrome c family protein
MDTAHTALRPPPSPRRISAHGRLALAAALFGAVACSTAKAEAPGAGSVVASSRPLPRLLSETGLYVRGSTSEVRPEHLFFVPQYPLWSDGATKRRFVSLPPGSRIDASTIAQGKHLVDTAACHDCHTPLKMGPNGPEPDLSRMLSGHPEGMKLPPPPAPVGPWIASAAATNTAWAGPWGVSFTANLTPDKETGLGAWNKKTFVRTIKTGRHMGAGRPILPPMPIPVYRNFTEDELGAIFAYLRTIPALKNKVPDPIAPGAAAKPVKG